MPRMRGRRWIATARSGKALQAYAALTTSADRGAVPRPRSAPLLTAALAPATQPGGTYPSPLASDPRVLASSTLSILSSLADASACSRAKCRVSAQACSSVRA